MDFVITRYILNFFDGLSIIMLIAVLFKYKFNFVRVILFLTSTSIFYGTHFFISLFIMTNDSNPAILVLITSTAIIASSNIILQIDLIKAIISILLSNVTDLISICGAYFIFHVYNISEISTNLPVFILGNLICFILKAIIIAIIGIFMPILKLPAKLKIKYSVFFILNLIFTLFSFYSVYLLYEKHTLLTNINNYPVLTSFFLSTLIYLVFTLFYTVRILKTDIFEQELQYQKFHNQTLDILMSDLRRFKHDYDNTIAVIDYYVKRGRLGELSHYMDELTTHKNFIKPSNIVSIFNIKNIGLAGVLVSKIDKAKENEVDLKLDICNEINQIEIPIRDLCEITSILIDNAIEASADSEEKTVRINILDTKEEIIIAVENSVKQKPDISKINQKGWSTKGESRGLGLWIANNLVNKYKNTILNTSVNECSFKQELIIGHNSPSLLRIS